MSGIKCSRSHRRIEPITSARSCILYLHCATRLPSFYVERLLIFGIFLFGLGVYLLTPVFTTRADLIPISGPLATQEIQQIPSKSRYNRGELIPTLFFTLKGDDHIFRLTDETNFAFMGKQYDCLVRVVDTVANYTVYIDEDDQDELYPKVFQIECRNTTILEFETVRTSQLGMSVGLLMVGAAMIVYALLLRKR